MNRIVTFALLAPLCVASALADLPVRGDLNGNGTVDADDAFTALQYVGGLAAPTPEQWLAADVASPASAFPDGHVGMEDALHILRAAHGLETLNAEAETLLHILSTGQSLSVGVTCGYGWPWSSSQPYQNVMLSGSAFTPLVEVTQETPNSARANMITALTPGRKARFVATGHGVSGYAYPSLKRGTQPYTDGMAQIDNARSAAAQAGKNYRVAAVTVIHGESDQLNGVSAAEYENMLVEWQHDYETDAQFKTGQTEPVPLFTDQMHAWTHHILNGARYPTVTLGQLAAAENHPGKIYLIGPKYQFEYCDGLHLGRNSRDYQLLGELQGKVMKQVLIDGIAWRPLSPNALYRQDNVIYARFHVPWEPLRIDTDNVLAQTNFGFEYTDDSGAPPAISSVELDGPDTVKITLAATPTGANPRLRYAFTGERNSPAGHNQPGAPRGNLRDSDATPSIYNAGDLYNWAVTFDKPIADAPPTAPTVRIIAPVAGASVETPASLIIEAEAAAVVPERAVTRVSFYNGARLIGADEDGSDGWSVPWSAATTAMYYLTAQASDGVETATSNPCVVRVVPPHAPFPGPQPFVIDAVNASRLEVENFDQGGAFIAYRDSSPSNGGGAGFRTSEDVDVYPCGDPESAPCRTLGEVKAGDWLEYTVAVSQPGDYNVRARVASNGTGGSFSLALNGGALTPTVPIPNTMGWDTWQDLTLVASFTEPGVHTLRISMDGNGPDNGGYVGNINFLEFTPVAPPPPPPAPLAAWDLGDSRAGNAAPRPR